MGLYFTSPETFRSNFQKNKKLSKNVNLDEKSHHIAKKSQTSVRKWPKRETSEKSQRTWQTSGKKVINLWKKVTKSDKLVKNLTKNYKLVKKSCKLVEKNWQKVTN